MDYNCWYQSTGTMILLQSQNFAMNQFASYQNVLKKELHSIAKDPRLMDITKPDFHLNPQSPCIDAGENAGLQTDFEGTLIPQGSAADIGAYESAQILP
ncbi:MAG: choice-of-anchor Q domain-containing protein, partial [Anaerohalosphaeraceae bacterium]